MGNKVIEFHTTNSSQSQAMMKLGCIHWASETVNFLIDKIGSSLSCHSSTTLAISLMQGRHHMPLAQPSMHSTSRLDAREPMIAQYLKSSLIQHAWVTTTTTINISYILTNVHLRLLRHTMASSRSWKSCSLWMSYRR